MATKTQILLELTQILPCKSTVLKIPQTKIVSPDKIVFGGLEGTLGGKTLSVGYEVEINGWKSRCIEMLSRSIVINFSNADQLKLIGIELDQLDSRLELSIQEMKRDIAEIHNGTKKVI